MLSIAILGQISTSPGQTYGISVFNESFRHDLQLSHTQVTAAYMLGTLLASFPVWFVGALMDRYGIRRPMFFVVLLFGAACVLTSQVNSLFMLFCAFLFLRMLGQGALSLLSSNTLSMWFDTRLGTAAGIMSLGTASAFAVIPAMNLYLIDELGWRTAYVALGVGVWIVMLPLILIFYRNRPEDIGQALDGMRIKSTTESPIVEGTSLTLREAQRTRAYWILLVMHVVWALVGTAIVFHIQSLFHERGLTKGDVAMFFSFFALSMAVAHFAGGLPADRVQLRLLLFLAMIGMTLSLVDLIVLESVSGVRIFAIAIGASQGLFVVLGQTIWARFYGRAHLGKIRGTIWTACVAGSSAGPFVLGLTIDLHGSFTPALWLFAGIYFMLSILACFATRPRLAG